MQFKLKLSKAMGEPLFLRSSSLSQSYTFHFCCLFHIEYKATSCYATLQLHKFSRKYSSLVQNNFQNTGDFEWEPDSANDFPAPAIQFKWAYSNHEGHNG